MPASKNMLISHHSLSYHCDGNVSTLCVLFDFHLDSKKEVTVMDHALKNAFFLC